MQAEGASLAVVQRDRSGRPLLETVGWRSCAPDESRGECLERLVKGKRISRGACSLILGTDAYQVVQVDMVDLPVDEKREAARWQIRERTDYPPQEAVVDLFEVPPVGGEKKPLNYVVAARQSLLRERVQEVEQAGLALQAIDIPEFALRNICGLFSDAQRGLAILLLLESSGLLVIVRDRLLYLARLLSIGMNDLLSSQEQVPEAMNQRFDEIVLEIQRSFDFCERTFQLPMPARLLVAQTRQELAELNAYLQTYLGTPVEPFSFSGVLDVSQDLDPLELNRHLLAIGGALRQEGA